MLMLWTSRLYGAGSGKLVKSYFTSSLMLVKDKDEPRNTQGPVYKINCSDCHASYIGETGRDLTTRLTEHKRATRKDDVNNHIAEHHRLTNHTIDWDSAQCLIYSTNYFQRLTLESWYTNLEQIPSTGVNHYRQNTNVSFTTLQTNRIARPNFTNGSKPTNHDWPTPLESYSQWHHGKTDQSVYTNRTKYIRLTTTFHLTLMMTSAQVVETSVTITDNSPSQDYTHPDDQTTLLHHVTPGF